MKKFLLTVSLFILVILNVYSYPNNQKIYSAEDPLYKKIETLHILEGKGLPSSSSPWSEDELLVMMEKFDPLLLEGISEEIYKSIMVELNAGPTFKLFNENLGFKPNLSLPLELYSHINREDFTDTDDWYYSFNKRLPALNVSADLFAAKFFYAYFEITLGNSMGYNTRNHLSGESLGGEENHIYRDYFNINIPFFNDLIFSSAPMVKNEGKIPGSDFDLAMPYKALLSFGGKNWNITGGRDRISWGDGVTGNLLFSSSFPRHTFIRFSTYFKHFKYSLLISAYPSPDASEDTYASLDGYKALMAHRIECTLFDDKLRITLTDAITFWSLKDQNFNLFQINPFGFYTGENLNSNSNSMLISEISFTPCKGIAVYTQAAIDEIALFGNGKVCPPAFGLLFGIKMEKEASKGILSGLFEFVYTNPFLYIRGNIKESGKSSSGFGFDAFFRSVTSKSTPLTRLSLGYPEGNDCIIFNLLISYEKEEKYSFSFGTIFSLHGSMNISSLWNVYDGDYKNAPKVNTPTTFNPFSDYDPKTGNITQHEIEQKIILSLHGEYYITKNLVSYIEIDPIFVWNQHNAKKNLVSDLQTTLGIKFSL